MSQGRTFRSTTGIMREGPMSSIKREDLIKLLGTFGFGSNKATLILRGAEDRPRASDIAAQLFVAHLARSKNLGKEPVADVEAHALKAILAANIFLDKLDEYYSEEKINQTLDQK